MSKFFSRLPLFLGVALEGIRFWAKTPLNLKLRLDRVYSEPYPFTRLVKVNLPDNEVEFVEKTFMSDPNLTTIEMSFWENHYKSWYNCSITLNQATKEIQHFDTTLSPSYQGSGMIGVVIFSLPAVLLCLPYIIAARLYYMALEKIYGISRHHRAVLNALKNQLDPETKELLVTAMQNDWKFKLYLSQKLTFTEAKKFLSQQRLKNIIYTFTDLNALNNMKDKQEHIRWYDEKKNMVAEVLHPDLYGYFAVRVLGSVFTKKKAKQLLQCHKTMEETVINESDLFDED